MKGKLGIVRAIASCMLLMLLFYVFMFLGGTRKLISDMPIVLMAGAVAAVLLVILVLRIDNRVFWYSQIPVTVFAVGLTLAKWDRWASIVMLFVYFPFVLCEGLALIIAQAIRDHVGKDTITPAEAPDDTDKR